MTAVRRPLLALAALVALAFAACGRNATLEGIVPDGADARARAYLALFARGQVDSAAARLVPAYQTAEARVQLDSIAVLLRDRQFDTTRMVGAFVGSSRTTKHVNISYELHSPAGWLVANVSTVQNDGAPWAVDGVQVFPTPASLESANAFSLGGRTPRHYLWLLLTVAAAVTSVGVAVHVARERAMPKRWRWVLLALLGAGSFTLDWTTGAWRIQAFAVNLFAATFLRAGPAAPWLLSFSIPLGAFLSERHLRTWRRKRADIPAVEAAPVDVEPASVPSSFAPPA